MHFSTVISLHSRRRPMQIFMAYFTILLFISDKVLRVWELKEKSAERASEVVPELSNKNCLHIFAFVVDQL